MSNLSDRIETIIHKHIEKHAEQVTDILKANPDDTEAAKALSHWVLSHQPHLPKSDTWYFNTDSEVIEQILDLIADQIDWTSFVEHFRDQFCLVDA